MSSKIYLPNDEEEMVFKPPDNLAETSHVKSMENYNELYDLSLKNCREFWSNIIKNAELKFRTPWNPDKFLEYNFDVRKGPIFTKWMPGSSTNICYNCLDRNVENGLGDKIAFYWEGNYPHDDDKITYKGLLEEVCKFSNVLKCQGVKKGDRVAIYLPMIVQLPVVMLACARIGAIHSIVFGGFSAESLATRILDAGAEILITADGVYRGTKLINLKDIADEAAQLCSIKNHSLKRCIVVKHLGFDSSSAHTNGVKSNVDEPGLNGSLENRPIRPSSSINIKFNSLLDVWYHEVMSKASPVCDVEWMDAEDPLFMLYTSGSTGTPKGVLHTQAGYMLYTYATFRYVFDYQTDDIFFCTADIGWITGHSYVTYGPLLNGATGVIFEGLPFYPDAGRFWDIVDKYSVTKFYTAPTAIRALMKQGDSFVKKYNRKSLKILGTVGEPINPEAWLWYHRVVGDERCPIVDTYWQTETGGHVLTPLPMCTPTKPGSAAFPFFGVEPALVNDDGCEIEGPGNGFLVFKRPWPGIMRTVFGNHERFEHTYFKRFPGYYFTGDGCRRDEDGYYWITGRVDDMMNVSGHLLSTAEIESALVSHKAVAEAAVVAAPHEIKGQIPYCFVTLKNGYEFTNDLVEELKQTVRKHIGPVAVPDILQNAPGLPKTRSGKIMRRILRKVVDGQCDNLGDLTTLADESVIEQLVGNRKISDQNGLV